MRCACALAARMRMRLRMRMRMLAMRGGTPALSARLLGVSLEGCWGRRIQDL